MPSIAIVVSFITCSSLATRSDRPGDADPGVPRPLTSTVCSLNLEAYTNVKGEGGCHANRRAGPAGGPDARHDPLLRAGRLPPAPAARTPPSPPLPLSA